MRRSLPRELVPVVVFLALLVGHWVSTQPNGASDTRVLVAGADVALDCLRDGTFYECGTSAEELEASSSPYREMRMSACVTQARSSGARTERP